jgi:hypothetical protein
MFANKYGTRQKESTTAGSLIENGWVSEIMGRTQRLLRDLSSVLSFIPHLASRKSLLVSPKQDIGMKHLKWINGFTSRFDLLPTSLMTLFNQVTKPWFSPFSFAWFDPKWRSRRKRWISTDQTREENGNEDVVNYLTRDEMQPILKFSHVEEEEERANSSIPSPFLNSKLTRRQRQYSTAIGFPQAHQYPEKPVPGLMQSTGDNSGNQMISSDVSHRLADDQESSVPSFLINNVSAHLKSMSKSMSLISRFISRDLFSSNVTAPLQMSRMIRELADDVEVPSLTKYIVGMQEGYTGESELAHPASFNKPSLNFFRRLFPQKESLTLTKMLPEKAQWLSHKKETQGLPVFDLPADRMGICLRLPDSALSPGTPNIPVPPIEENHNGSENMALSTPGYTPFSSFSFGPMANRVSAEKFLASGGSIHSAASFPEDMTVMEVDAVVPTCPKKSMIGGYYGTDGIELALAPLGRSRGANAAQGPVSIGDHGTGSASETEETPALDYEALASEVYGILKKRLLVEKERAQGMR